MKKIYLAALAGSLGMMSYGLSFGWPSPSLPLLLQDDSPVQLTLQEAAWVTSSHAFGAIVGSVLCTYIVNVIGRKWTLLFTAAPASMGWLMVAFASSVLELYVGRFLCGSSIGFGYVAVMMYTGEISPASVRGTLTLVLVVSVKIGILIEWTIGPFLRVKDLALLSLCLPILFVVNAVWLPESPYHLMRRGRHQEAIESLAKLRGVTDVSEEAGIIEKSVKIDLANDTGLWELLSVSGNRKALTVVVILVLIQQWSGSSAILSYAELIFNATGNDFEGKYVTMIMGAVQAACAIFAASIVDRFGRRTLLMISTLGTFVSTMLVGLFFFLQQNETNVSGIVWLPAAGAILYIIMYALGLAGLPFTMMSEVFPTNVKALGSTIAMFFSNCSVFVITLSYQSIAQQYGVHASFWMFSAVSLSGFVFVYLYVPETRGKTLQEVQDQLHGRKLT
ncbi:facilitated trehalose transporter Tret1-like [Colletes gigas]|uniref:facilitated trehalose transporter Tret1-like n=1 Tax=Colletes gigas TaxID=935657 RepID=UPI001C9B60FD|nr:facilitated trehalose transporter Tret1-like [Colletes gigas]